MQLKNYIKTCLFRVNEAVRSGNKNLGERGDTIVAGLMLTVLVASAALASQMYFSSFTKQARMTMLRSVMTSLEASTRKLAFQPYAYRCGLETSTTGLVSDSIRSITSCEVVKNYFANLSAVVVTGAQCARTNPNCGFKMTVQDFQVSPRSSQLGNFRAQIIYDGLDVPMKPIDIDLDIPSDLLQSSQFDCSTVDPTKPVFVGYKTDGSADCRGFNKCPQGSYAAAVDFASLTLVCKSLYTADKNVSCGYQQGISQVSWDNGTVSSACAQLPDAPFTAAVVPTIINPPPPPPTPTPPNCRDVDTALGPGTGATPRYWGGSACQVSCSGTYRSAAGAYCAGGCYQGARGWMYCNDCHSTERVCN